MIIAIIESLGFPSFLTKQIKTLFSINAGENSSIVFMYVSVISKTSASAPNTEVKTLERKTPHSANITDMVAAAYTVLENTLSAAESKFYPYK